MLIYTDKTLEEYKTQSLLIDRKWNHRDFVSSVQSYYNSKTEKILAVSGLRGTGKTVGILQAAEGQNFAYVLAQKGDGKRGEDYISFLKTTDKKCIVLDEYGWIEDRDALDRYLLTAVQNGKRIVITGTESITLDFLNYGALNHRVDAIHTTMFTYEEYLRLYGLSHSKETCREFLLEGGLFKDYALKNFETTKRYVEEAIVENLAGYLKDSVSTEMARALTYAVLYKAICPSNLHSIPTLRRSHVTLENFLDSMGINTTLIPKQNEVDRVADIFEQVGVIVRIPNLCKESDLKEQYYIVNPSLSCQLIMAAYGLRDIEASILGHVFEAAAAVQVANNRLSEHDIFFYNNSGLNESNKELDLILTDRKKEHAYLMECKYSQSDQVSPDITLLTGELEQKELKYADIDGRYIIYNGKPCIKNYSVGPVVLAPIGEVLNKYFEFNLNMKEIEKSSGIDKLNETLHSILREESNTTFSSQAIDKEDIDL